MPKILFLTEAGENIGFGHYSRCSALREYFSQNRIISHLMLELKGKSQLNSKDNELCNWRDDRMNIGKLNQTYDTIIIDSYLAEEPYYEFLSKEFDKVFALDDYNRITYDVDLILNPNIYGDRLDYSNQSAKIYGGKDYVILRAAFREKIHDETEVNEHVRKVVITVGGSDIRNLLPKIAEIVLDYEYDISIVCGSDGLKKELLEKFSENQGIRVLGYLTASEMYEIFSQADIVISAGGQTLHELASMGKPTIGICTGDDQKQNIAYYVEAGFLSKSISWDDSDLSAELNEALIKLKIPESRQKVSSVGKALINGEGVNNIYELIN